jgi:hypothetical protein
MEAATRHEQASQLGWHGCQPGRDRHGYLEHFAARGNRREARRALLAFPQHGQDAEAISSRQANNEGTVCNENGAERGLKPRIVGGHGAFLYILYKTPNVQFAPDPPQDSIAVQVFYGPNRQSAGKGLDTVRGRTYNCVRTITFFDNLK